MQNPNSFSPANTRLATPPISASYNLDYLDELGSEEYVIEALGIFVNDIPAEFDHLWEAVESKNYKILSQKAHRLKSCVGLIQANTLLQLLVQIEENALKNQLKEDVRFLVQQALLEFGKIRVALKRHLQELRKTNSINCTLKIVQ